MKTKIAIDGPAGAGKSTVARMVAQQLGLAYLDTGAMYRAVTLAALRNNVDMQDAAALAQLTGKIHLDIQNHGTEGQNVIYLDGEDVSSDIRSPEISRYVSYVARCPQVRNRMVDQQRKIGSRGGVVMDGRDIGTHVMPDADYKFYLTASLEERARRRAGELSDGGEQVELTQMAREIAARDKIDSERECSPLRPADDSISIDTTDMTIEQVIATIVEKVEMTKA